MRRLYPKAKRLMDVAVSAAALGLVSPLILVGALATKATSPGPAFYRAKRAGLGGEPFAMYKLRTMRVGTDAPDRRVTAARDERVTAVGGVLRRFKIDELPQFWNVLRG
ncbi:MAG TPA: sugar transferase, partial [Micromonosporaceae bacterium]|nr:sugar transferase [Micromonosporaceae bacterium]